MWIRALTYNVTLAKLWWKNKCCVICVILNFYLILTALIFLYNCGLFPWTHPDCNAAQAVLMTGTKADRTASSVSGLLRPVEQTHSYIYKQHKHLHTPENHDKHWPESLLCSAACKASPRSRGMMLSWKNCPISSASCACAAILCKLMHAAVTSSMEKLQLPERWTTCFCIISVDRVLLWNNLYIYKVIYK